MSIDTTGIYRKSDLRRRREKSRRKKRYEDKSKCVTEEDALIRKTGGQAKEQENWRRLTNSR